MNLVCLSSEGVRPHMSTYHTVFHTRSDERQTYWSYYRGLSLGLLSSQRWGQNNVPGVARAAARHCQDLLVKQCVKN